MSNVSGLRILFSKVVDALAYWDNIRVHVPTIVNRATAAKAWAHTVAQDKGLHPPGAFNPFGSRSRPSQRYRSTATSCPPATGRMRAHSEAWRQPVGLAR